MPSEENTALLPLFRPSPLDSIPVYSLVLQYHDLLELKVDMKYDELRSPQINALLIKPLVTEIKEDLSQGSLYALMACMVQFQKEASANVVLAGVSTTRAMICEIIAIKLLKEFEEEDLINALTYDFFPLANGKGGSPHSWIPRWQRISTMELAIDAEAKKLLAHPAVAQIIEQIWNGAIMFQSSIHKLHRIKFANEDEVIAAGYGRRGPGSLYDYSDASLFKLSRLRVPRYRNIVNMISFCILLALYIKVLADPNNAALTASEIVFGLWSLGFILDEIVAFADVGLQLYVMSLWNLLDLLILCLLISYAVLRASALHAESKKLETAAALFRISRDVLASIAIFLFPRLFSIFDTNESFARMVVAVRRMSLDLFIAWIVIIVFSCGFWVAFTMAFARDVFSANEVAFDLMKILFGFTPAVWENWKFYSDIGRCILLFYLFITHFVILTILIAVLSDSFSKINLNSREEHRFLFTVNTISMIKSESSSLFSYTAPLNLLEWLVRPLSYMMSLRQFLVFNRTIIKATHFPVLLCIFIYERVHYKVQQSRLRASEQEEAARQRAVADAGLKKRIIPSHNVMQRRRQMKKRDKVSNLDLLDEVFRMPHKGSTKFKKADQHANGTSDRPVPQLFGSSTMDGERMSDVLFSDIELGRRALASEYDENEENSEAEGASTMTREAFNRLNNRLYGTLNPRKFVTHSDSFSSMFKTSQNTVRQRTNVHARNTRNVSAISALSPVRSGLLLQRPVDDGMSSNMDARSTKLNEADDENEGIEDPDITIQDLYQAFRKRKNQRSQSKSEDIESQDDPYEDLENQSFIDNETNAPTTSMQLQEMISKMSRALEEINRKLDIDTKKKVI